MHPSTNMNNSTRKTLNCARTLFSLLVLATLSSCENFRTSSPTTTPAAVLWGMPSVIRVAKGTKIETLDGVLTVPETTNLWSQGAYEEQLEKAIRP